ncbi:MAG: hypothetical protein VX746_00095 [Candidatus Neomarinimicrobiota bacterium]|jgi:hypothetical protein|nr:hypothetical protein [Candidatus Neomarinimicrobiota bacterium]MEC7872406.1 hypothetical protein [Candidatus Neomarinimicrobiota bacterium]MEC9006734.1 hypothetical protein [Candidatus Neomarinimicrobiota bacterium]MEC9474305.1 hypothetical protein [Candidatus Neomarinimicrobiota bacterium]MEE3302983.1 hypothetical protein [Candidatus Neomarinimicrobiota bacterium]|tara:strand:- start:2484 stop:2891 length:408 start_codon:yes stop_codon:yes gene_type:complete
MQKREKILMGVLGVILIIFLFQQTAILFNTDQQNTIKQYDSSDLQKFLTQPQLEITEKLKLKGSVKSNFFYRLNKQSAPKPILNEIILGPDGYAAMISGNFVLEGDKIFGFVVNKIEKKRVLLRKNNQTRILKRK